MYEIFYLAKIPTFCKIFLHILHIWYNAYKNRLLATL